jgi:uncharacterized membrane protein
VHGARIYRWRGIIVFTMSSFVVGAFFEVLSLPVGFPFGHYRFTYLMGPAVFGVPIMLALAYVGMGYLSWVLGLAILQLHSDAVAPESFSFACGRNFRHDRLGPFHGPSLVSN